MEKTDNYACDFCNAREFTIQKNIKNRLGLSTDKYEIIQCPVCDLISLFPHPHQQEITNFYKNYGSTKNRFENEYIRKETVYPEKLKKLKKYATGNRLLDIGAGLGTFSSLAQEEGFDVTSLELSSEQCKIAKENYNIELINSNIFEVSDTIGKFDIVHLHHVLEHLTSPNQMFNIFDKLLNNDGILLFEVPYQLKRIQDSFRTFKKKTVEFNFDHLFFFSPKTIKNYVRSKNFKIIEFNQHRPIRHTGNVFTLPRHCIRYIFHKLTTFLWMPSGGFIEIYCRKKQ